MWRFVAAAWLLAPFGCEKRSTSTVPRSLVSTAVAAVPVVTEQSSEMVFQWIADDGDIKEAKRASDVPTAARSRVRVIDARGKSPPPGMAFIADMTKANDKGEYAVRFIQVAEFSNAQRRRSADGPPSAGGVGTSPSPSSSGTGADVGAARAKEDVILYATSWCGVCEQARSYLKRRKISYIEKDIEKDPAAASEMKQKADAQGVRAGGVPIIDVRGKLMAGFNPEWIEKNLR